MNRFRIAGILTAGLLIASGIGMAVRAQVSSSSQATREPLYCWSGQLTSTASLLTCSRMDTSEITTVPSGKYLVVTDISFRNSYDNSDPNHVNGSIFATAYVYHTGGISYKSYRIHGPLNRTHSEKFRVPYLIARVGDQIKVSATRPSGSTVYAQFSALLVSDLESAIF